MGVGTMLDLTAAAARNLAGWHESSLRALGVPQRRWPDAWLATAPPPPIYFSWIGTAVGSAGDGDGTLPSAEERIASAFGDQSRMAAVSDPWRRYDLAPLGFEPGEPQPWMVRDPDADAARPVQPPELRIEPVADPDALVEFERTAALGFEVPPVAPFEWHGPGVLVDPRFRAWIGRVDGEPATVAMAYLDAGVVGVYGVATIPRHRGRGYGSLMTSLALRAAPSLPAVLQPSPRAEPLYARLGFRRFASFDSWHRAPVVEAAR
jgi:GNAT superfamily N-acetyltransferase